nr:helix-turn-helix transcriptional regulator [uncultured Fretibacterium sp.]
MDAAQRIARATPFEAASTSIGLGLFLVWLSQAPSRALLPVAPILLTSFLFAFALSCTLIARTNLPGPGSFARTIWLMPCLLLPLPLLGGLWGPLKIPALLLPAFGAALLFCRWMTLCARFSPRTFPLLYGLSTLASATGRLVIPQFPPLLHALPFLSTGLLLLAVRERRWMPEGEHYASPVFSSREGVGLIAFALVMNVMQIIADSGFSAARPLSSDVPEILSALLSLAVLVSLLRLNRPISCRGILTGGIGLCAAGILLVGVSAPIALLSMSMGCFFLELSFWLLMLQFAAPSPNPARMICIGASLLTFALIASRTLLNFLSPLGAEALSVQSGFALFTGLISAVFVLLPRAAADIPAPASAAPIASAAIPRQAPTANSDDGRELRLKERFEALGLTRQEIRITMMLLEGTGDEELCGQLFISRNTLKFHIRNINRKLGTSGRRELPSFAERLLSSEGE